MPRNLGNLLLWHIDKRVGGARGFVVIGETHATLIAGKRILAQKRAGEKDQAMTTQGAGADMGDYIPIGCHIYFFRLPIDIQ
ncbi:MAG TPA: hypothetical protein VEL31_04335 [Ktedonobacteraceae bacterium]|nr:hypothetical protein [Ktedonobacteraceae bacterium]